MSFKEKNSREGRIKCAFDEAKEETSSEQYWKSKEELENKFAA